MRLDLTVYDATLPEIEDIEYTRGNDPIIVELDPATFTNWEPEVVSYKAFIIDSYDTSFEITASSGEKYPFATFDQETLELTISTSLTRYLGSYQFEVRTYVTYVDEEDIDTKSYFVLNIVEGEPSATAENAKPYFDEDPINLTEILVGESFRYTLPEP